MTSANEERRKNAQEIEQLIRFQPLKYVHIFFSGVLIFYGVGIFLITITVRFELSNFKPYLDYYIDRPVLVLVVGSIALISLGSLGVVTSSLNLYQGIITFGVLLFGLFMFELTMGAIVLATLSSADEDLSRTLREHLGNYANYSSNVDHLQSTLKCCGFDDPTDWNSTLGYLPGSCCNSDNVCGILDAENLSLVGCYKTLQELVEFLMRYLLIILGVLAALEIVAMAITFYLARGAYRRRSRNSPSESGSDLSPQTGPSVRSTVTMHNPLAAERSINILNSRFDDKMRMYNPIGIPKPQLRRNSNVQESPARNQFAGNSSIGSYANQTRLKGIIKPSTSSAVGKTSPLFDNEKYYSGY
ncbi:tetraspanin-9-like [Athalia rosae]|uniref:tetraspanin-9-like n=1 Tax=Athalia rosae TaxID=37344 RepID=UPI002033881B|nr:tetraspanin-9-like [Athalia rosae]